MITFFIGNGFDLNIGLKTKYQDFLEWYKGSEFYFLCPTLVKLKKDREKLLALKSRISEFRKEILKEFENWSDLEIALGKVAKAPFFTSKELFLNCKYDLDLNLQCYLSSQNKRAFVNEEDCYLFMDGIVNFWQNAPESSRQIIINALRNNYMPIGAIINVVSFNYTDIVGELFNGSDNWPSIELPIFAGLTTCSRGSYLQIHGQVGQSFILGVDDIDQIERQDFQTDSDIQNFCVKRNMHKSNNNFYSSKLTDIISQSSIFCIFGMSIGKTDKTWWRAISNSLKNYPFKTVIIYVLDDDFDTEVPYISQHFINRVRDHFCEQAELSKEIKDVIYNRIIVIFNSHIFDLPDLKNRVVHHDDMEITVLETLTKRLMPRF